MRGLLSMGSPQAALMTGLLGRAVQRPMADEGDEVFLRRYAQQGYEGQPRAVYQPPAAAPAAPSPAAPRRSAPPIMSRGMSLLQFVAGGTEGVHQERERRRAELSRPEREARMAQLREMAGQMGPAAMIAFETNPEKFGESLAAQYAPQVIASGGIQSVIGSGTRVSAPRDTEFGDTLVRTDPLQPTPEVLMQRGPTFAENTARMTAEKPIELAPGTIAYNRDGSQFAQGAQRILSAGDGSVLVTETGAPIYNNPKDTAATAAADPAAAEQARAGRLDMANNLRTGLEGARRFTDASGVWSQWNPLQRQSRANLEAHLDTLKGNITFEKLSAMKAASPTGASGLGALSDNEARMLASTVAALSADMSSEELSKSFEVIDRLVAKLEQDGAARPAASGGPIAEDGNGNRIQWNGSAWVAI